MNHPVATPSSAFKPMLKTLAAGLGQSGTPAAGGGLQQRFAEQLARAFDLDAVLRFVLAEVAREGKADRAFIALVNAQGQICHSLVWGGEGPIAGTFPHSQTVLAHVLRQKEPLWISNAQSDPRLASSQSTLELDLRSVIAVPLKLGDSVEGLLYLDCRTAARPYSPEALAHIETLAGYATIAVANMRLNEDIHDQLQKFQRINDVSLAINATLKLDQLLALILRHSLSLSGGDLGYILLGEDGEHLECLASIDRDGNAVEEVGISRSIVSRCVQENRPVCILDTHEDLDSQTASVMALELRSVICVPLLANQHRIGVLYLSSQALTKTFTPQDQGLLEAIANQAALTIRNAQLLKEQERQIRELERALLQVREAQQRAVTDGLTGLYNHIYFKEQLYASVLEAQRYGGDFTVVMIDLDHFKAINDTHGHQTGDEVLRQTSAAIRQMVRDCDMLARYGGEELALLLPQTDIDGATLLAHRICERIAALRPTGVDGAPVPVTASLGVASYRNGLTATELVERADKALYAAKRSGRNRVCVDGQVVVESDLTDLREKRETQSEAFLGTVSALAEAVNAKDRYTAGHSHHVESLATDLAQALGLSGRELAEVEMAALLHDVGKIGVPDAILNKPAALDEKEWAVMRTHPVLGAQILQAGNMPGLARAVRHHHERWDGKGYPDGLCGEEIPLASRIVAVIDAWGAMVTDRVYRKAPGRAVAVSELKKHAGTQFDPRVVEPFLALVAEKPGGATLMNDLR